MKFSNLLRNVKGASIYLFLLFFSKYKKIKRYLYSLAKKIILKIKSYLQQILKPKILCIVLVIFIFSDVIFNRLFGEKYLDNSEILNFIYWLVAIYLISGFGIFIARWFRKTKKYYLTSWVFVVPTISLIIYVALNSSISAFWADIFLIALFSSYFSLFLLIAIAIFRLRRIVRICVLTGITIFVLSVFGWYLYKLHSLAVEGNKIFEQRCLNVNPHLIGYKNSFLMFADYIKNPDKYSGDQGISYYKGYVSGMKKYVEEENKWLEADRKYLNRWDFKLIEPGYIKIAGEYQWKIYEAYRDDAQAIMSIGDAGGLTTEIDAKQADARDRLDKYSWLYFDFLDKASAIQDWRKIFGNVPIPKGCTEENMRIPNTRGVIDWEGKSATPSPTFTEPMSGFGV